MMTFLTQKQRNPALLDQNNIEKYASNYVKQLLQKNDKKLHGLIHEINKFDEELTGIRDQNMLEAAVARRNKKVTEMNKYIDDQVQRYSLYSIILFDEIERANPSLYDFLLAIADTGRSMMGNGSETFFYKSFIFMTSNIGHRAIADILKGKTDLGFVSKKSCATGGDPIYENVMAEVRKIFDPAFIGRIEDEIVVFKPLSPWDLKEIMELQLNMLINRFKFFYSLNIEICNEVKDFIIEKSCDHPELGARLIKKKIKYYIENPLGKIINSGQISKNEKIIIGLEKTEIFFAKYPHLKTLAS